MKSLSPTAKAVQTQKNHDRKLGTTTKNRESLCDGFTKIYTKTTLARKNFEHTNRILLEYRAERIAIFSLETHDKACHRSLLKEMLIRKGFLVEYMKE